MRCDRDRVDGVWQNRRFHADILRSQDVHCHKNKGDNSTDLVTSIAGEAS